MFIETYHIDKIFFLDATVFPFKRVRFFFAFDLLTLHGTGTHGYAQHASYAVRPSTGYYMRKRLVGSDWRAVEEQVYFLRK